MAPTFTQGQLTTRCADSSEDNTNTDELKNWKISTLTCALALACSLVIVLVLIIKLSRRNNLVRNAEKNHEKATKYKNAYRTAETQAAENQIRAASLTSEITRLREVNAKWERSYHQLFGDLSDNPTAYHPQRNGSQGARSTTRPSRSQRADSPRPSMAPEPQRVPSPRQSTAPLSSGILRGTEFEHGKIDDGYFGPSNRNFTPLNLTDLANGAAANYVVDGRYIQPPRVPIPQETRPPVRFKEPTSPVVSPHQTRISSYWAPCRGH